ncbi:DUF975 family protein [Kiritimatiellaeota bacterium B1221]|nr:DUF975 family protein [Kiritimatiellaeota bacterium B1221]
MNWFYGIGGQQFGPVELSALLKMVSEGKLKEDDLVWHAGMGEQWQEVRRVPELQIRSTPAPRPPSSFVPADSQPAEPEPVREPQVTLMDEPSEGRLENAEITRRARASLKGLWGLGIAVVLLQILLVGLANNIIPVIAGMVLSGPFMVGVSKVFLSMARKQRTEVGKMFDGFQCFGNAIGTYLVSTIFIFLWSLLFLIPGIIASMSYSMIYFILVDDPKREPGDVLSLSKDMMQGYKWQFFCLYLRFLGWSILSVIFTLGVGLFWVFPYIQASSAHFYEMVRKNYMEQYSAT